MYDYGNKKKKESQLKILCRYFHGFIAEDINFLNNLILAEYDDRENMSSVICEIPVWLLVMWLTYFSFIPQVLGKV